MDILQARQNTIKQQVRPWGGLNNAANDALISTHREDFVPEKYKNLAFSDIEIPLSSSSKMLSPKLEGRILDAVNIQKDEDVLQVGTGSGYLTAVISLLCKSVTTIEISQELSSLAQDRIKSLDINNAHFINMDVRDWRPSNFFNVVIFEASVPKISASYLHLLSIGGRMFIVEGKNNAMSAKLITRTGENKWQEDSLFEIHLDSLIGSKLPEEFEF